MQIWVLIWLILPPMLLGNDVSNELGKPEVYDAKPELAMDPNYLLICALYFMCSLSQIPCSSTVCSPPIHRTNNKIYFSCDVGIGAFQHSFCLRRIGFLSGQFPQGAYTEGATFLPVMLGLSLSSTLKRHFPRHQEACFLSFSTLALKATACESKIHIWEELGKEFA